MCFGTHSQTALIPQGRNGSAPSRPSLLASLAIGAPFKGGSGRLLPPRFSDVTKWVRMGKKKHGSR